MLLGYESEGVAVHTVPVGVGGEAEGMQKVVPSHYYYVVVRIPGIG